jgi:hypothetical protein
VNHSKYTDECLSVIAPYLNGTANTCSYCDHLDTLILQEGLYTYITIAIGQIIEGYLQVCSQKHRTAATGLYAHEAEEMITMKKIVRDAYEKVYGNRGVAFEHGKAGSCLWKEEELGNKYDLCYHAHIHFVPAIVDIRYLIKQYIPTEIKIYNYKELREFRTFELGNDSYLYFEGPDEIGYVYPVIDEEIPRQFLRKCVALELNVPDRADWINHPGAKYFEITKKKTQARN